MANNENTSSSPTLGMVAGMVVAGAAVAAGAAFLTMALLPSGPSASPTAGFDVSAFFKNIGTQIANNFSALKSPLEWSSPAKALAGAGLVGGGMAMFSGINDAKEAQEKQALLAWQPPAGGYADRLELSRLEGLTQARMGVMQQVQGGPQRG